MSSKALCSLLALALSLLSAVHLCDCKFLQLTLTQQPIQYSINPHLNAGSSSEGKRRRFHISASKAAAIVRIRGGKDSKKSSSMKDLADEETVNNGDNDDSNHIDTGGYSDDDYFADEDGMESMGGGGLAQNPFIGSLLASWRQTPPMTQAYIGSSVVITLACWLLNKNTWPPQLLLDWKAFFTGLQLWRPITSFLFFGQFGLNYLLTIQFVWQYMAQLEKLSYKKPAEFLVMMVFGAVTLLAGYTLLGLSPQFLGHNLSTFLVYIWSRIFEGTDVNIMDLLVLRAEVLPWFFCAQTLVLDGEIPFADLLGIVVGHLYHYLSQRKLLQPPAFVEALFSSEKIKALYAQMGQDFEI